MEVSALGHRARSLRELRPAPPPATERLLLHGGALATLSPSATPRLPQLRHLNVASNALGPELDLAHAAASLPALEYLDGAANDLRAVANAQRGPAHLHTLVLAFNQLANLTFLGPGCLPQLARLDVRDNDICSLAALAALRHAPALRELRLQNAALEPAGAAAGGGGGARIVGRCANAVCALPGYAALVLALCPALELLDELPVGVWREHLATAAAAVGAVGTAPGSGGTPAATQPPRARPPPLRELGEGGARRAAAADGCDDADGDGDDDRARAASPAGGGGGLDHRTVRQHCARRGGLALLVPRRRAVGAAAAAGSGAAEAGDDGGDGDDDGTRHDRTRLQRL